MKAPEENRFTTATLSLPGSLDELVAFTFLNEDEMLIVERKGGVKAFHVGKDHADSGLYTCWMSDQETRPQMTSAQEGIPMTYGERSSGFIPKRMEATAFLREICSPAIASLATNCRKLQSAPVIKPSLRNTKTIPKAIPSLLPES